MGEHHRRQLHPDPQVHPVAVGGDIQLFADPLHPLAAAAAHGDDEPVAAVVAPTGVHGVAVRLHGHLRHRRVEEEVHRILQVGEQVLQHHIVDVRAQVPDGGVQQVQFVLDAQLLEPGPGGGIELGPFPAVGHVDGIHIFHQLQGFPLADVLVEGAAEVVGDVVLAVGEGPRAAEAGHDGAGLAADAGLDLLPVDGAAPLLQRMSLLKHGHPLFGRQLLELVGGIDAAGAAADDDHVILLFHGMHLLWVDLTNNYTMFIPIAQ